MKRIIQMLMMLWVYLMHMNTQTEAPDIPKPGKNSIFFEGFGNGIYYSINYDHLTSMKNHPKIGIGARIGVSNVIFRNIFDTRFTMTTLPAEIYLSYGRKSCLELGSGLTCVFEEKYEHGLATVRVGYRYRGPQGFMLGAGFLATMDYYGMRFPYPQLSFGFTF